MPFLGALICASPVDHAVHDAFGRQRHRQLRLWPGDVSSTWRYLGPDYRGVYPSQFLRQDYLPQVPVFHLVGGLDLLRAKR